MKALKYGMLLLSLAAFGQSKEEEKFTDDNIVEGNNDFAAQDYLSAEAKYRMAQSKSPSNASTTYNLGNAIYRQGHKTEAAYTYAQAIKDAQTKEQKHKAYHNLGNVFMQGKSYKDAVEAYRNALRNNPYDEETRYNFALAKKMLKDNPPPKAPTQEKEGDSKSMSPKNKGKNPNKGGEGDQKTKVNTAPDSNGNGEQKQRTGSQGIDNNGKGVEGAPKPDPGTLQSRQRMENLLDAMNDDERKTQEKVRAVKVPVQRKQEKDW